MHNHKCVQYKKQRVILSEAPPRFHFGYASCFWGKPQKFDKLRMTPTVLGGAQSKSEQGEDQTRLSRLGSNKKICSVLFFRHFAQTFIF